MEAASWFIPAGSFLMRQRGQRFFFLVMDDIMNKEFCKRDDDDGDSGK